MGGLPRPARWRTPEELVGPAFERSRLVLVNEAHNGERRSVRCRQIGVRLVVAAHRAGVRHLAMEALYPCERAEHANRERQPPRAERGYLAQPEMRELIGTALGFGWTLVAYEADMQRKPAGLARLSMEETNWREEQQALNLADALAALPPAAGILVWCGNHHLAKRSIDEWRPMGSRLQSLCGVEPFAVDQTPSIRFDATRVPRGAAWADAFAETLTTMGGTAGFLSEDAPPDWPARELADAYLLSTDNELSWARGTTPCGSADSPRVPSRPQPDVSSE